MDSDHPLIAELEAAREELDRAEERVEDIGEGRLRDLTEAHEELTSLFSRYEERATGSGDFGAFIEFQEALGEFVEDLPNNLPNREAFEDIDERLQKRRLTEGDFAAARDRLSSAEDRIARLEDRREAEKAVEGLERQVREAIHETRTEIDRLETVLELGEADLDAPVEDLRDPIEAYNESVRDAFEAFRTNAPAREVIGLIETAEQYPLLSMADPPDGLLQYLESAEVGAESIPTLLEYSEYSRSKLQHYVDTPATFQRVVGGNRTYLDRLDATALTIEWPPPAPGTLRWRSNELVSMLDRFAPAETVVALESVLDLARSADRYRRLRQSARARAELTDTERERLAAGTVEDDLAATRKRLDALEDVL